jgi:hypothetical protein
LGIGSLYIDRIELLIQRCFVDPASPEQAEHLCFLSTRQCWHSRPSGVFCGVLGMAFQFKKCGFAWP